MKLRQKSRWGLLGVLGCGFFAPTASTGMLFQSPNALMIENNFFLIPQTKDTPVPIVNILGEKENSVILKQNTSAPF